MAENKVSEYGATDLILAPIPRVWGIWTGARWVASVHGVYFFDHPGKAAATLTSWLAPVDENEERQNEERQVFEIGPDGLPIKGESNSDPWIEAAGTLSDEQFAAIERNLRAGIAEQVRESGDDYFVWKPDPDRPTQSLILDSSATVEAIAKAIEEGKL